ncbi:MAG: MFS transporter [Solirubrobacteraceae bacterium]
MSAVADRPAARRFTWRSAEILALSTLCIAQLIESIDVTVVNVALPAIRTGLNFSQANLQWVVSAYTALFGGFLLLGGRCGDLFGKRAVFTAGVTSFTAASLVCGLAQSETLLIAGRAAQGLLAAFIAPATLALITTIFAEGSPRDRAMGIWGAVTGLSASLGVICGGALADGPEWRWIFVINLLIGVVLLIAARRYLPDDRSKTIRARLDLGSPE